MKKTDNILHFSKVYLMLYLHFSKISKTYYETKHKIVHD